MTVALGTALRRGELLALRWQDVEILEGRLTVRQSYVRGEFTTPKSRTSRRTIELGPRVQVALGEQWESSRYRADGDLVHDRSRYIGPEHRRCNRATSGRRGRVWSRQW